MCNPGVSARVVVTVAAIAAICVACVGAQDTARTVVNSDWDLSEEFARSPSRWAFILNETSGEPMWPVCRSGTEQSPADVRQAPTTQGLRRIVNTWVDSNNFTITNDGVRIRIVPQDVDPAFVAPNTGVAATLRYITVAVPSGHRSGGSSADLELQFVHGAGSNIAAALSGADDVPTSVISVPFVAGYAEHKGIAEWVDSIPVPPARDAATGTVSATPATATVRRALRVNSLLPPVTRDYVAYDGSEVNPPCREGVRHFVFMESQRCSFAQIASIRSKLHVAAALQSGWPPRAARASRPAMPPSSSAAQFSFGRYILPRDDTVVDAPADVEAVTMETITALVALCLSGAITLCALILLVVAWCYPRVPS